MDVDKLRLFRYLNKEYNTTFSLHDLDDVGQVPFVTGELKQDAYLVHVRNKYGVGLTREDPNPANFSSWLITVIDEQKFTWLMLKI